MDVSALAKQLWPFLRERVAAMITSGVAAAGSGSGSLSAHSLSGAYHTGLLDVAHGGTNASTESGARANLGLAIGVDVQAYNASLDALSGLSHADGEFIVGNGTGFVNEAGNTARTSLGLGSGDSPTFAGLTINGSIAVTGTVDGVDVSDHSARHESGGADTIHHDSLTGFIADEHIAHSGVAITGTGALGGGGTIAASRTISMNTPGTLAHNSANSSAVANHTHAVTASADVSAGTQSLLKSDASGGLVLNNATINGDDFTVGPNGSTPLFTVDQSAQNVGILRIPDAQFALDVNGPLRATYLIGKHAIQLSDVTLLAHFDGPGGPDFNTDFTGTPMGHMGQLPTVSGHVIYRPGKWGSKAVQLAEATTNLVANPSFETGTSGWGSGGSVTTWERSAEHAYVGSYSLKAVHGAGDSNVLYASWTLAASTTYTLSAYVYIVSAATTYSMGIENFSDATGTTIAYADTTKLNQWQRLSITFTTGADVSGNPVFRIPGTGYGIYIDAVQLEAKAYATPYHDGSMTTPASWTGTAHASTSTRTGASLKYPIASVGQEKGTWMAWVKFADTYTDKNQYIIDCRDASNVNAPALIYLFSVGRLVWFSNGSTQLFEATALSDNTWYHIAVTYDYTEDSYALYINGVEVDSVTTALAQPSFGSFVFAGSYYGATNQINGWLEDLVFVDVVYDADQIRAVYESDAPVFAESSVFSWRTPTQTPIWVDEEGLWARGYDEFAGDAIFGVYGGGDTKAWGGKTLYQGDILMGNGTDGYVWWHSYQDTTDPYGQAGLQIGEAKLDVTSGSNTLAHIYSDYVGFGLWAADDPTLFVSNESRYWGSSSAPPGSVNVPVDAGDVGIGDPFGANVFWDESAGQLQFRDNATVHWYTDTEGLALYKASGYNLDLNEYNAVGGYEGSSIKWIDSGTGNAVAAIQGASNNVMALIADKIVATGVVQLPTYTTTQRNALTAANGMIIYNSTTGKIEARAGGAWVALH